MAPPPASASAAPAPSRRHGATHATKSRRPSLRLVRLRSGKSTRRGHLLEILALVLVVGSLLAVVIGQALLANDQVQMSALQHGLSLEQSVHRQAELQVAGLETPQRIVGDATKAGLVHPAQVTELPYVSLAVPIATPNVTAATTTTTAPPPTTTTTTTSVSTTSSSGTTTP
jgi:type II secretory pathway pseudopilin PulG